MRRLWVMLKPMRWFRMCPACGDATWVELYPTWGGTASRRRCCACSWIEP